jgi:threonine/homoserine/homoserine lactone efflux protein
MVEVFWKGCLLGFAIAVPVGPVGLLCIRKTLQFGRTAGICAGLGAATADTVYGSLAAFGLSFLSVFIQDWSNSLRLIGNFFLLFLGYRIFFTKPLEPSAHLRRMSIFKDFFFTFFLTLTNPLTLIGYLAVFAAIGLKDLLIHSFSAFFLILGIFIGTAAWWLLLSESISRLRGKLNQPAMSWINRVSGIMIGVFGFWNLTALILNW